MTNTLSRLDRAELVLMDAAQEARRRGLALVYDIDAVYGYVRGRRRVIGCCLTAALDQIPVAQSPSPPLSISNQQWDAIEQGFDDAGWPSQKSRKREPVRARLRPWFALGRRCRRRLNPVAASEVVP